METDVKKPASRRRLWGGIILATVAALFLWLTFPSSALAWDDCPYREVDCAYPGYCSRYVDTNDDGICDRSQSETAALAPTTGEPDTLVTDSIASATESSASEEDGRRGRCARVASTESVTTSTSVAAAASVDQGGGTGGSGGASFLTHYYISPIALAFFLIYMVSFFLHKTKRIRMATHRKIWNVLLLVTFLITGVFGLVLVIQLDYELPFRMPIDLLFWHVEAGIVMTLISLFHIGWHFNYYRNLMRSSRRNARLARTAESVATPQAATEIR